MWLDAADTRPLPGPADAPRPPAAPALLARFLRDPAAGLSDSLLHHADTWSGKAVADLVAAEFGEFTDIALSRTPHSLLLRNGDVVWTTMLRPTPRRDPALRDPALRDPALRDPALREPAPRDPAPRVSVATVLAGTEPFSRGRSSRAPHPAGTGLPRASRAADALVELRESVQRHFRPHHVLVPAMAATATSGATASTVTPTPPGPAGRVPGGRSDTRSAAEGSPPGGLPARLSPRAARVREIVRRAAAHSPQGRDVAETLVSAIHEVSRPASRF